MKYWLSGINPSFLLEDQPNANQSKGEFKDLNETVLVIKISSY